MRPLLLLIAATLCGQTPTPTPSPSPMQPTNAAPQVTLHTNVGDLTLELWPDVAPRTVENFVKLSEQGFYDKTAFHRVIKGFMIQGGCPNTKPGATGTPGTGGPGYQIKAEFNDKPHVRGVLSMARSSDPDSAGCQFFICHGNANFLDRQYTAFGKLIAGDDVLEKIANLPCSGPEKSTPSQRIEITKVTVKKGN